jgi:hypothetical protein
LNSRFHFYDSNFQNIDKNGLDKSKNIQQQNNCGLMFIKAMYCKYGNMNTHNRVYILYLRKLNAITVITQINTSAPNQNAHSKLNGVSRYQIKNTYNIHNTIYTCQLEKMIQYQNLWFWTEERKGVVHCMANQMTIKIKTISWLRETVEKPREAQLPFRKRCLRKTWIQFECSPNTPTSHPHSEWCQISSDEEIFLPIDC